MNPITIWQRLNEKNEYEHNHIEDGHCESNFPTIKFDSQKGWKNGKWNKHFALLNNGIIEYV